MNAYLLLKLNPKPCLGSIKSSRCLLLNVFSTSVCIGTKSLISPTLKNETSTP